MAESPEKTVKNGKPEFRRHKYLSYQGYATPGTRP